ncbi:putative endonuclease [Aquipseudomonas alcaligenes NBRC 14159]|uniref:Endonuclease n=1 Tax=Aquipseudomonas alcaligenes (strain ATCC 14909 / DSM 50342 / CCUG 1425 / JCM 20561 / NBRC 14159 / NCIMB 9945 / NCTC 10367 / 1577) TaxID=1215092 RepID=U2ZVR5_AQUA1|nr:putative endonuclease [Pseudomonas alcaligenes NBRC 14159]
MRHEPLPPPVPVALTVGAPLTELDYGRFQIMYDCQLGEPHRVTYLVGADKGALERVDNFRVDRSLPEGCKGQHAADTYKPPSGFDRGHLAPANHFDDSRQAMNASNLMTNIVPQLATHNRHTWGMTETLTECYRDIRPVQVIAGVVFGDLPQDLQNDYFVQSHGIATPEYFWKVLLTEDEVGQPLIISWWIPHKTGLGTNLDPFVKSVREIEVLLGPYELPIDVPEELKDIRPAHSWARPHGCDTE